ncbi:hypothetical protein [Ruixingdingia sedimenti]|uniref:DUF4282 domain-containing protein n=1 Tax=Ruixingdingia sedimenti TaxID=3073604 RepID=A0ABU1FGG6_9RHOB|nr:hypothetical protein [Xinfangfangia sp. LG-4]MDR5655487.1 hypothetical protein [Xinfangfangia sp. LG-4]
MWALVALAWAAFFIAGVGILAALAQEDLPRALLSVSVAVSGVLFLALNRIISALEAIRDAVAATPAARGTNPPEE